MRGTVPNLPRPKQKGRDSLLWRLDTFNKFLLAASPVTRLTSGIGREVCATLGFTRMIFLNPDFHLRRARGGGGYGFNSRFISRIDEPIEQSPWVIESVLSCRPAYVDDALASSAIPHRYAKRFGVRPLLCVPVRDRRGTIGVMLLDRKGVPFQVNEQLIEVAQAVGNSIGLALEAAASMPSHIDGDPIDLVELTPRERQILKMLCRGFANKEIASATGLSVFTVRDYVSRILRTLNVLSRSAAVARAWELGLTGEVKAGADEGDVIGIAEAKGA